jgi:chorismate synthase
MTISFDLVILIGILGGLVTIYSTVRKILKEKDEDKEKEKEKEANVLKMLSNDKEHLTKLDNAIDKLQESTDIQGDMIYAMLSHMATNNNTGGMQSALDKYNSFYRRNH